MLCFTAFLFYVHMTFATLLCSVGTCCVVLSCSHLRCSVMMFCCTAVFLAIAMLQLQLFGAAVVCCCYLCSILPCCAAIIFCSVLLYCHYIFIETAGLGCFFSVGAAEVCYYYLCSVLLCCAAFISVWCAWGVVLLFLFSTAVVEDFTFKMNTIQLEWWVLFPPRIIWDSSIH